MKDRFVRVLQKDIVTDPKQWKGAGPGKFIKLSNKAKNTYSVLSVIAFSNAGNAEGKFVKKGVKLGKGWFWTSHTILQQLTGHCQKTVQRAIKELKEAGFIGYYPSKKPGQQCFFKIKRIDYNKNRDDAQDSRKKGKYVHDKKPPNQNNGEQEEPNLPDINEIKRLNSPNIVSEEKYETPDMPTDDAVSDLQSKLYTKQNEIEEAENPEEITALPGIPNQEVELFNHEGAFDENGKMLNEKGCMVTDYTFSLAEQTFKEEGEMAFLEFMRKRDLGNHLVSEYREKYEQLKN